MHQIRIIAIETKALTYRAISQAITKGVLLLFDTSNIFGHLAQTGSDEVPLQLGSQILLDLADTLLCDTEIGCRHFLIPQVIRQDTAHEYGTRSLVERIGEL